MYQLLVILLVAPAALCFNCTGKGDADYEISCKAYTTCTAGVATRTVCQGDQVYNDQTRSCDDMMNVKSQCGKKIDCSKKVDGHYVDMSNNCYSYYTCAAGQFFGHNFCPAGTVFDAASQGCNWPQFVDPPCGTKGHSTPSPNI